MCLKLRTAVAVWATIVAASPPAVAQFPALFEVSGQYVPGAPVGDVPPTEVQVTSYDLALNVPLVLDDDSTYLILGAAYHVDSLSFSMAPPDFVDLRSFHSTEVSMLLIQLLPDEWSLSFHIAPGLAGDFQAVDADMLRLNTLAMASHSLSDRFSLGGGLLTTYSFGALLLLPAISIEYRPVPNVLIEGFLPAYVRTKWTLWNRLELGVTAEFQGNEYAVRDRRIRESLPCRGAAVDDPNTPVDDRLRSAECLDHVAYSVGIAGGAVGVRLWETMWLTGFVGHTFFRRIDAKNAANETLPDGGEDLNNELVVRVALAWRLPAE